MPSCQMVELGGSRPKASAPPTCNPPPTGSDHDAQTTASSLSSAPASGSGWRLSSGVVFSTIQAKGKWTRLTSRCPSERQPTRDPHDSRPSNPLEESNSPWLSGNKKKDRSEPASRILSWFCGAALRAASWASLAPEFLCDRTPGFPPRLKPRHRSLKVPPAHPDVLLGRGKVLMAHEGLEVHHRDACGCGHSSELI